MKNLYVLIVLVSAALLTTVNAQDHSTRLEKQHNVKFINSNLERTEEMILTSLESGNAGIVASSVQTIRQLQQIYPDKPFSSLIDPLIKIVSDEEGDTHVRILSALALDGLHSKEGDDAIFEVSKITKDQSVKDALKALSVESFIASQK